jgi:NAD(P)-dependent dehydrogenase (short-subunit alcohol dehydrogenase family)
MTVEGSVALVTGVTSGLGEGIALDFAARGMRVLGTGRRDDLGKSLQERIRVDGGEMTFHRADVTSVSDCRASVAAAVEAYGRLDVLICNAGFEGEPPVVDTHLSTEEHYDAIIDTNLKGTFFSCQAALAQMVSQNHGGVILNIASINATNGASRMAAYSASKAAVVRLSATLADEYLLQGIRINAITMGGVATEQAGRTQDAYAQYLNGPDYVRVPSSMEALLAQNPRAIAATLALLCDPDAAAITGANIAMDKAMTAGFITSTLLYMTSAGIWTT